MTVLAPDDPRHGTVNGYGNLGCRCSECRKAQAAKQYAYMHRTGRTKMTRVEYVAATTRHGTTRYRRGDCRCDVCREAMRVKKALQRERNPEFVAREERGETQAVPREEGRMTASMLWLSIAAAIGAGVLTACWIFERRTW